MKIGYRTLVRLDEARLKAPFVVDAGVAAIDIFATGEGIQYLGQIVRPGVDGDFGLGVKVEDLLAVEADARDGNNIAGEATATGVGGTGEVAEGVEDEDGATVAFGGAGEAAAALGGGGDGDAAEGVG